jgi:hypothetical protein
MPQTPWPQSWQPLGCIRGPLNVLVDTFSPPLIKTFKMGKIWRLIFERKKDFSLEIWINITFW